MSKAKPVCVFQDWLFELSMQQQSVALLACRGPDGIAKFHPCKQIVCWYRAAVLKAAYLGRPMHLNEINGGGSFMTLADFGNEYSWRRACDTYFDHVDNLPHHYHTHLFHGAEIVGYKHPHHLFRERWSGFFYRATYEMHLPHETEEEMDKRLCDWNQENWDSLAESGLPK